MTMPAVAVRTPLLPGIIASLERRFVLHQIGPDPSSVTREAAEARALITTGGRGASADLIAALPRLEIIAAASVGFDGVDLAAAQARGIRVTNTPDVLTDDVADLAIALTIGVYRQLVVSDRYVRSGGWETDAALPLGRSASGRRLGIVGLGRIGKAIAARAAPMMTRIAYTGRHPQSDAPFDYYPSVTELADAVDILMLALPATPETIGLVGRAELDALGPDGVLINIARGSVIDEPELVAALVEGRIGGAGLDVFTDEPHVPEALRALDNVVLQSHRGSATTETRLAMGRLVIANLDAHFAGRPLPTPVV